ncbi:putative 3-methyladenine DNA glycosylase [Candidatus Sulfotelmatomonas gaucii]|uniref:Putative 3-methyladenine DNA glycosylase n=1 Tax=Candidatus Sulfuritelmatomonas gaucii TaxID=2043161 RepID=A0A2N9L3V3_9BACT|nr:putative 3-methyladenine DNA glycosylase [Candidatus Sulfotelmatomonas gaucii]
MGHSAGANILSELKKMPGRLLERAFFEAPVVRVAPRLLGKLLVNRTRAGLISGRIVEVEAYLGPHNETADPAAHSHRGPTPRNRVLFGPAGHAYVYSIYGQYYCMNITCEMEGQAGSILLRALEPVAGLEQMARNRGLRALPPISFDAASQKGWRNHAIQSATACWNGDGGSQPPRRESRARQEWRSLCELTGGPGRLCQALNLVREKHNGLDLLDPESPLQVRDDGRRARRVLVTRRIGISHAVDLPLRFAVPGHPCVSGARSLTGKCIFLRAETVRRMKLSPSRSTQQKEFQS